MHSHKLVYLEIGRAIAALAVVLHHADQATAHFSNEAPVRYFLWAQFGVDFFFVLSGFIIFHAHRNNTTSFLQARIYVFKRMARIYVPYLPIALIWMGLLVIFEQGPVSAQGWGIWPTLTLFPMEKKSALSVAWSLTYELIFYSFFLLAFIKRSVLYVVSIFWSVIIIVVKYEFLTVQHHPVLLALSDPIILEFFCGAIAAVIFPKVPIKMRVPMLLIGILSLLVVVFLHAGQRIYVGPPMALIVLASAIFPYTKPNIWTEKLAFLGAASYAIYLVHSPVVSILAEVLQPLNQRFVIFTVCAILGCIGGVVYHVIFERRAMVWVQRFRPASVSTVA